MNGVIRQMEEILKEYESPEKIRIDPLNKHRRYRRDRKKVIITSG